MIATNENNYTFLTISNFKTLEVEKYMRPGFSCNAWCKLTSCKLQRLMFPYGWLDSYKTLSHVGPAG